MQSACLVLRNERAKKAPKTLPNTEITDHFSSETNPETSGFEVGFIAKTRASPFGNREKFLGGKHYVRDFP